MKNFYIFNKRYVDRNEDGTYNAVYIQKDSNGNYKGLIQYPSYAGYASEQVTPSSGIQGIFISFEKLYNVSDSDNYKFLKWDGETQVVAQEAKDMKYQIILLTRNWLPSQPLLPMNQTLLTLPQLTLRLLISL
jgi:hypothetical protein